MTRIQPECYIESWRWYDGSFDCTERPCNIMDLHHDLLETERLGNDTIALFLIKPQSTTLAERLEARKVNNNLNQ